MAKEEVLPALTRPAKVHVPYNEKNDCGFNKDERGDTLSMNLDGHHRNYHGTNNLFYGWQAYFDIRDGLPDPDPDTAPLSSIIWRMALAKRPEVFEAMDLAAKNEPELAAALYDFHMLARARQIARIGIEHYQQGQREKLRLATDFMLRHFGVIPPEVEKRQMYYLSQSLDAIFKAVDEKGMREEVKPESWCK